MKAQEPEHYEQWRNEGKIEELKKELLSTVAQLEEIASVLRGTSVLSLQRFSELAEAQGLQLALISPLHALGSALEQWAEGKASPKDFLEALKAFGVAMDRWAAGGSFRVPEVPIENSAQINALLSRARSLLLMKLQILGARKQEAEVAKILKAGDPKVRQWSESNLNSPQDEFDRMRKLVEIPTDTQALIDRHAHKKMEAQLTVEGIIFFLTTPHQTAAHYKECLMFVLKEGVLYPRVAYKSHSGAAWRITITASPRNDPFYNKGIFYTQGTKPCVEVEQLLYALESRTRMQQEAEIRFQHSDQTHIYYQEINQEPVIPAGLETMEKLEPSRCFSVGKFDEFKELDGFNSMPRDFIPDFKRGPIQIVHRKGEFSEKVRLEHYIHAYRGELFHFWMAFDEEGRVWVERIYRDPRQVTSYGTHAEVFEWAVCSKPFDYKEYANGLSSYTIKQLSEASYQHSDGSFIMDYPFVIRQDASYVDTTPALDHFELIKRFRAQRNICRKLLIPNGPSWQETAPPTLIAKAGKILRENQFPPTPEIDRLMNGIKLSDISETQRLFIQILENPGLIPSVTLRALRYLIPHCIPHADTAYFEVLEALERRFHKGFPAEKGVYVALYRDIVELGGGSVRDRKPRVPGGTYVIEPLSDPRVERGAQQNPAWTRYKQHLKLLETTIDAGEVV